jgi:hypothetical protein
MDIFATIIVANKNKAAVQDLSSEDMFTTELKKGIRKYWVSSGYFTNSEYDALCASELIHEIETDESVKPSKTIADLGMIKKIIEV